MLFGVEAGDEVMLPPTAPVMTILPILSIKAKPVFIDLDDNSTMDLSLSDVKKKITKKLRRLSMCQCGDILIILWLYRNPVKKRAFL
jgi:dTDP-4-amino-4,6-dideoxygalactose transaminase